MKKNIVVIGAGITGLYTAIVLSQYGHNVTVYDTKERAGGILTDIIFKNEHYFKACQLLNANSEWFSKLVDITDTKFEIFEPEYSSFINNGKNVIYSDGFSVPVFDKFEIPEITNSSELVSIKDRVKLYDPNISDFLEKMLSNYNLEPSNISTNCAINLQINRVTSISQQDKLKDIKSRSKIFDEIYAIDTKRLKIKYLVGLPQNGYDELFNDLVEKFKNKINFKFNTKIIPYWDNNKLKLKSKNSNINFDSVIWTGNPTPLINSYSKQKMKSVVIRVKQLNLDLNYSDKKFYYTQVFSLKSPIYRFHIYHLKNKPKISIEMIDANIENKKIINQLFEILRYLKIKIEINEKTINTSKFIRHDLTTLRDEKLIKDFQKNNSEKKLINSPWQEYGRDKKILSLLASLNYNNLI